MSYIVSIRDIPEDTSVQIPNSIVYGEGVHGNLNFHVERVGKTDNTTTLHGRDTAGSSFRLVFDSEQSSMRARVFNKGHVSPVAYLEKGGLIIFPDSRGKTSVAEVVSRPVVAASETVVGLRTADGKARNYRFPLGELVELFPSYSQWEEHLSKGDVEGILEIALQYREPDPEWETL